MIVLMYQAAQAIVQPVADKRMLTCLHCVSEGVLLLLKVQGMVFIPVSYTHLKTISRTERNREKLMEFYRHGYIQMMKQYDGLIRYLEK